MPAQASGIAVFVAHLLHGDGEEVKRQTFTKSPASSQTEKKAPAQGCRADGAGVYDVYSGTFWSSMVDIMPN